MTGQLTVLQAGPSLTVQDLGRPGFRAQGLTKGGAADTVALFEGAALLGQPATCAAIEMVGTGGSFTTDADLRIALTGAPMTANIDGTPLVWNASHLLPACAQLTIGGVTGGTYGYLHVGGGIATNKVMGSRSNHLSAGLGAALKAGDTLQTGPDERRDYGMKLSQEPRFDGGTVRVVSSMQTEHFTAQSRERFTQTEFRRDPRANRQGVRMDQDGEGFFADGQLSIVSEVIVPGDIQITGDGAPFVLMCECQTTGGYPRIGTVIPSDLPRVAQAPAGSKIQFEFISLETAFGIETRARAELKSLTSKVTPLVRDPGSIRDLLSYQLVSGAVSATANPFSEEA